jgi:hypothetical protein
MNEHAPGIPADVPLPDESAEAAAPVDPAMFQRVTEHFRTEQNLVGGLVAGLGAALIGAGLWMAVTVTTGYQIGWMAVGIGVLVGLAVRYGGKGIDSSFGVVGAVLALFGCLLGNLLAMCQLIANFHEVPLMEVLGQLTPQGAVTILVETFTPIDLLFYGIAVYEGFKLSKRQITPEQFQEAMEGAGQATI